VETIISDLVQSYEKGALSRRQLIQGLAMLAAAGGAGGAGVAAAQQAPFKSTRIDHVSMQVTDLPRSIEFYQKVFGLDIVNEDKRNEIVRMGTTKIIVSLHHKEPTGLVDHFAIAVDGFKRDEATASLAKLGLKAEENLDYGFYVRSPDGIPVQIVGT
jgi:catechol 2,3-dioxygenase-like lactoylglutathione lyase family enzyme